MNIETHESAAGKNMQDVCLVTVALQMRLEPHVEKKGSPGSVLGTSS